MAEPHSGIITSFEQLARAADATVGLAYWAKELTTPPRSRSSRLVERTIFTSSWIGSTAWKTWTSSRRNWKRNLQAYKIPGERFLGNSRPTEKVGWRFLVQLADVASLLVENNEVEDHWKNAAAAVQWYSHNGWQL